jgi:glutathione S-transferase
LVQVHKALGPLFNPALTGEARAEAVETAFKKLALLEERAGRQSFLAVPDTVTVADYLLFPMIGWLGGYLKVGVLLGAAGREGCYAYIYSIVGRTALAFTHP